MEHFLGIDIGGMTVKGIIIDGQGNALAEDSCKTQSDLGAEVMCENIALLISRLLHIANSTKEQIAGVGIGCPGIIDSQSGRVIFAGNLGLKNYPLGERIAKSTGLRVKVTNDANAAALGEAKFGAGSKFKDSILITLGTGVGGGIVIGGKLFEGGKSAGTEIGHTVIVEGGLPCNCGRRGCLEKYASAKALMEQTAEAMKENAESAMWKGYDLSSVSGKTAFEYYDSDRSAKQVVDNYIKHLACGVVNLANIFRPEVIMLGGGVSEQGERLTKPLQKILDAELMGGTAYAPVKVVKAALSSRAGAYGAAALFM